jgi:RNA polymerase sigma factor (sigma-70 family)
MLRSITCHMRRADSDLLTTPPNELRRLNQDELLRMVVICRDGNEEEKARARGAWIALIESDLDRVRAIVKTFRFPKRADVQVRRDLVDDAVNDAYERLIKMLPNFKGATPGEYRAAMRTCVHFACMDHCIDEMEHEQGIGGSLEEKVKDEEGDARGKFDPQVYRRERERLEEQNALEQELERQRELLERIDQAAERLEGNRREVWKMTQAGRSVEAITAELGVSRDSVYQYRRRALQDIKKMLDRDGQF